MAKSTVEEVLTDSENDYADALKSADVDVNGCGVKLKITSDKEAIKDFTLIIFGFDLDSGITVGKELKEDEKIGTTTDGNICLILIDNNRAIVENIEDYIKVPESPVASFTYQGTNYTVSSDGTMRTKFINSFENGAVADFLYGNGSYSSYVAKFVTEDKQYFKCYNDGTGRDDRNFGFGVLHYLDGKYQNVDAYKSVGININDGTYNTVGVSTCPVSKVVAVQAIEMKAKESLVIRKIGQTNWNKLTTQQQDCLVDIAYQGCNASSWAQLKKLLDSGASAQEIAQKWPRLTSTQYNNQARANARKKLFVEGIYTNGSGSVIN